jgi:hypothetical protein
MRTSHGEIFDFYAASVIWRRCLCAASRRLTSIAWITPPAPVQPARTPRCFASQRPTAGIIPERFGTNLFADYFSWQPAFSAFIETTRYFRASRAGKRKISFRHSGVLPV